MKHSMTGCGLWGIVGNLVLVDVSLRLKEIERMETALQELQTALLGLRKIIARQERNRQVVIRLLELAEQRQTLERAVIEAARTALAAWDKTEGEWKAMYALRSALRVLDGGWPLLFPPLPTETVSVTEVANRSNSEFKMRGK